MISDFEIAAFGDLFSMLDQKKSPNPKISKSRNPHWFYNYIYNILHPASLIQP